VPTARSRSGPEQQVMKTYRDRVLEEILPD